MVEDPRHNLEGDLHTQSVNSSAKADQWKKKMSKKQLEQISTVCGETIKNYQQLNMTDSVVVTNNTK